MCVAAKDDILYYVNADTTLIFLPLPECFHASKPETKTLLSCLFFSGGVLPPPCLGLFALFWPTDLRRTIAVFRPDFAFLKLHTPLVLLCTCVSVLHLCLPVKVVKTTKSKFWFFWVLGIWIFVHGSWITKAFKKVFHEFHWKHCSIYVKCCHRNTSVRKKEEHVQN